MVCSAPSRLRSMARAPPFLCRAIEPINALIVVAQFGQFREMGRHVLGASRRHLLQCMALGGAAGYHISRRRPGPTPLHAGRTTLLRTK